MTNELENTAAADNALQLRPVSEMDLSARMDADIRMAQLMAKAKYTLPKHFHNSPGECLAVIMIARDWNMNPYMVAQKTSIINNRLMYEGQPINAAIKNSRAMAERLRYKFDGEGTNRTCTCYGRIKGENEPREVTVGTPHGNQAKNSPLWNGSSADIDQQLTYKAARVWARRHAPELMLGVYAPEDDWHEEEPEKVQKKAANEKAVENRVALLDSSPTQEIDVTDEDFFTSRPEPVPAGHEREINDNPEDRKGPEQETICGTCGGRGIVEDDEGKSPCPSCFVGATDQEPTTEENDGFQF